MLSGRAAFFVTWRPWPADELDLVAKGDPVARLVDVWGRPVDDGLIRAEYEGFVIGRAHGIYFYPGDAVLYMAVRDEAALVAPYPEDYFTQE